MSSTHTSGRENAQWPARPAQLARAGPGRAARRGSKGERKIYISSLHLYLIISPAQRRGAVLFSKETPCYKQAGFTASSLSRPCWKLIASAPPRFIGESIDHNQKLAAHFVPAATSQPMC